MSLALFIQFISPDPALNGTKVELVMLSEAPLFGAKASYFYNPRAPFTAFFHLNDAESKIAECARDKASLLPELAAEGFIILDMFPFAFNENDTESIRYRSNTDRYRQLFERTAELYLIN